MHAERRKVIVNLFGGFSLLGPDGQDLTPRGAKVQALVALVATDKSLKRRRVWLQDKLWSDRGPEQAAGSLRHALAELRKTLGENADVLLTDRTEVALDPERVAIAAPASTIPEENEFLQGIDVRDPEFEGWLEVMRAHHGGAVAPEPPPRRTARPAAEVSAPGLIVLVPASPGSGRLQILEALFTDLVMMSVRESLPFEVASEPLMPAPAPGLARVAVEAFDAGGGRCGLRITIGGGLTGRAYWASHHVFAAGDLPLPNDPACLQLCHRTVNALPAALTAERRAVSRDPHPAAHLAVIAFQKMFTMRHDALEEADRLLAEAADAEPRALYDAWRAQLAAIRFVERQAADTDALSSESEALSNRALETDPTNSHVLSSVANARLVFSGDAAAAAELAAMAVEINGANPLAWWSLANARLYAGAAEAAHEAAMTAQRLAERSTLRHWHDFQRGLTAAVTGRTEEALAYCRSASALAPNFRPPLRYLTVLYARVGRLEDARRAAERLTRLEPDFTVERLVGDPAYPASLIRKAALIDGDRLRLIDV